MSPSELEFLIKLIGGNFRKRTQHSGKPFLFKKGWHWRFVSINSMTLPSVRSISQLPKRSRNHTTLQIRTILQDRSARNEKKGRRADGGDVSPCTSRPAQAVTDGQIPTAHRTSPKRCRVTNFDTLRSQESRPHCHDTVLRYAVTWQVRTHIMWVQNRNVKGENLIELARGRIL